MAVRFVDATDDYAGAGKKLIFQSVPNPNVIVEFKAFLTDFSDDFKQSWNPTEVYGRNDAVQTFKNTQRVIGVSFDVPAYSVTEAYENMDKCSTLARMLYPSYEDFSGATSIAKSPLLRIKFLNLISKGRAQGGIETGLLGVVAGFNFKHNVDAGYIDWSAADFGGQDSGGLAPKVINMSFQFTVLHEEDLGWDLEGNWRGDYGAGSVFPFKDRKTPKQAPAPSAAPGGTTSTVTIPELDQVSDYIPELDNVSYDPDNEADLYQSYPESIP